MANENLKNTLKTAGLTAEEFAEIVRVDPKTVQRWIAGRTPRPRHRTTIARALDTPEHELWPDHAPAPADDDPDGRPAIGDIVGSWGHADDPGAPDPVAFIAAADHLIDLIDDNYILDQPSILNALQDRAFDGCDIRILTTTPTPTLTGHEGITVRTADGRLGHVLISTNTAALFAQPLAGGRTPTLLELHRNTANGLFDRLAQHFQTLWQLYDADHAEDRESDVTQPARPQNVPPPQADPQPARRWPRRTS